MTLENPSTEQRRRQDSQTPGCQIADGSRTVNQRGAGALLFYAAVLWLPPPLFLRASLLYVWWSWWWCFFSTSSSHMPCENTVSNATLESSSMSAHVREAFTHSNLPSWPLTMEMTDAAPSKHCCVSAPEAVLLYSVCQDTDNEASRGTRWGRPGIRNKGTDRC